MSRPKKNRSKAMWLRRAVALLCFVALTAGLIAVGSSAAIYFRWIERLQIWAVAATSSLIMILFWLAFTLIFGRLYCSVICPLGIVMDIAARIPRLGRRAKNNGYFYHEPTNALRYGWLMVVAITAILGSMVLITVFDPSSAYAAIVGNALDIIHSRPLVVGTLTGCAVSSAVLLIVIGVAATSGRSICNSLCPVGSALSLTARYSLYAIDINTDRCIGCNRCVEVCKAHCIDPDSHTVDSSRCVVCFNCLDSCPNDSISYTSNRHRLSKPMMRELNYKIKKSE